ncbi:MAG: glycosyltransferase family 2 protein [Planctomycetes bacterium]|nr:glycosyltransferase family 2 protein [Planctomycetota bacterium]
MTRPTAISACVICFQEADRIADCLRSLAFCDEIVVVDSGSTDGTREIAAALGARVVTNVPFPGHREQKQIAVDLATHDWVLCLDADERVTPELRARIEHLREAGLTGGGYEMPRRNHYLGRIVKAGLFWPDRKLRLFDRRVGHWGGTNPHDKVILDRGQRFVRLEDPIEHLSYRDFDHQLRTIDSFSRISAESLHAQGRRGRMIDLMVRPPAVFVKSLLLKRGFLDGWRGVLIATMAFYYDWLKYARLRRLSRASPTRYAQS